jgi:fatty acid desaturase
MCKQTTISKTQKNSNKATIATNETTQHTFTIQDVTSHNTPSSAYALYQNKVLDITKFADRHPGGDIILLAAGKDATVLVETYHPNGVPMKVIDKLTIGTIDPKEIPPSYYSWSSPFYSTLRQRVTQRLSNLNRPLRGSYQIQFKALCILSSFWYSLYKMYTSDFQSACLWSVIMGVFGHWVGTCIQHDGNHGSFAISKFWNLFAGWTMDMIGASAFTWQFQHMLGHHPYTNLLTTDSSDPNLVESDPDVFSSYPFMRMHPTHDQYWYHAYQHLYAPILFAFMTLAKVFQQDVEIISSSKLYHIDCKCRYDDIYNVIRFWGMKCVSMVYMLGLPIYFHGVGKGLCLFTIGHCTCGEVLATMFIVNHVIEGVAFANVDQVSIMKDNVSADNSGVSDNGIESDSESDSDDTATADHELDLAYINRPKTTSGTNPMEKSQQNSSKKVPYNDWAAVQCQTSVNWSKGSWFWNHFSGGLNHQIEHHLFPSICHTNYVYIQDVVEETCVEFGVPYQNESGLWTAYGKMMSHLKIMGSGSDSSGKKID